MSEYQCQCCGENHYPDSLFPIKISLPMITGSQYFLVCRECYDSLEEKLESERINYVDEFQEVSA